MTELSGKFTKAGSLEKDSPTTPQSSEELDNSSSAPETPLKRATDDAAATQAVADLLGGLQEPEAEVTPSNPDAGELDLLPAPDKEEGGSSSPPSSLSDVAERLGVDSSELYEIEITTGDGEAVKLGDLKDAWQDREGKARETAERATALDARETAILNDQRLWGELGDQLGKVLTPQMKEQLGARLAERETAERRRMLEVMPELADEAKFDSFRSDVANTLADYGYGAHEIVVGDHRQIHLLRDFIRMKRRLDDLKSFKPERKPVNAAKPQKAPPQTHRVTTANTEAQKVGAVSALIGRN